MSNQEAKRHHYVPRFYLRRFADDNLQLRGYRRIEGKLINRLSVENAAVEVGFYSLDGNPEIAGDEAEQFLSRIEAEVASSLGTLISYWPPDANTRLRVSRFIALQAARTREVRHQHKAQAEGFARLVTDAFSKTEHKFVSLGDKGEPIPLEDLEAVLTSDQNQDVAFALGTFEDLVPYFYGRCWQLVRTSEPVFITSDSPVHIEDLDPEARGPRGIGYGTADLALLPLDSRHTLVMWAPDEWRPAASSWMQIHRMSYEEALKLAEPFAWTSYEWVFAHPDSNTLEQIDLPKGPRPLGQIGGLGEPSRKLWGPGQEQHERRDTDS